MLLSRMYCGVAVGGVGSSLGAHMMHGHLVVPEGITGEAVI